VRILLDGKNQPAIRRHVDRSRSFYGYSRHP